MSLFGSPQTSPQMDQFWVMGVLAGVGSRIHRREGLLGTNILGSTHRLPNGWGDDRATPSVIRGGQPDIWVFVTKVSLHLCRQATSSSSTICGELQQLKLNIFSKIFA